MVEETAGVTEFSGKYHPPVLKVLPARDKNRPLSKAVTNGASTPTTSNKDTTTGAGGSKLKVEETIGAP